MEVDEIQRQVFKFQRIGSSNGRSSSNGHDANSIGHPDEEEDMVVVKRSSDGSGGGGGNGMNNFGGDIGVARLCGWPSSRIVRVSRASGGKDRHSKVLTSRGLRDRRVRLSVSTAIQFYDLQDRLGYDQPSKAVEWLIKAASSSIAKLPSLNLAFPGIPHEIIERGFESGEAELDGDRNFQHNSSTSETSKGSGLSLSRSENRIKARERARERAADKEKEKENDSHSRPLSQKSSFTELLSAGVKNNQNPNGSAHQNSGGGGGESNLANNSRGQSQRITSLDYLFAPSSSCGGQTSSGFLRNMNSLQPLTTAGDHHHHQPERHHFSFVPENFVPVATTAGESYDLNFSMSSSSLDGFNRGTLQSNSSPSLLPTHIERFNPIDGSNINMSFFNGSTPSASNATAAHMEDHHQFPAGLFDAGLQLCYGETPNSDPRSNNHKAKGKR